MTCKLLITDRANDHIDGLIGYLINNLKNADAAAHLLSELERICSRLKDNPYQFPESKDTLLFQKGYREALLSEMSYRVVFRIEGKTVYIVGVFHGSEDYVRKVSEDS